MPALVVERKPTGLTRLKSSDEVGTARRSQHREIPATGDIRVITGLKKMLRGSKKKWGRRAQ